jgi:ATP phosphoribosyltransferase regulatory subunit
VNHRGTVPLGRYGNDDRGLRESEVSIRDLHEGRRWQLPDGVEEILPPRARRLEAMRRRVLDEFDRWGYELVVPPLIEYLDSLLVAAGSDLDLQTFKVTDQLSGRMMGVRADLTSQAARIDAHTLRQEGPTRLCYSETVLRTRPEGLLGSRTPIRIGAELFGVPGPAGDAEIVSLMVRMLRVAGVCDAEGAVQVELGHVAIYRALAGAAGLAPQAAADLFDAVQRKAVADVDGVLAETGCDGEAARMLRALPTLMGDVSVLGRAREVLAGAPVEVMGALDELEQVAELAACRTEGLELRFDLAELRGYNYHRGTVFSAYAADHARIVAGGGRYDGVGAAFGRARPATGFDAALEVLAELGTNGADEVTTVLAPEPGTVDADAERALWRHVDALRAEGARVVSAPASGRVDERLELRDGAWCRVPNDTGP